MTWTQPLCDDCYAREHPDFHPARLRRPVLETCCLCGCLTLSGIYVRRNPREVPYPRQQVRA